MKWKLDATKVFLEGTHKIKEEEGRLNTAGRLPNSYFILWMILLPEPESIHYAAHQTRTER